MEQKCANCGNGKWRDGVTAITETCSTCKYVDKGALGPQPSNWIPKPQTNADRIRAMSDEELADFFDKNFATCEICRRLDEERCNGRCSEHLLIWLKQPAEDGGDHDGC